MEERQQAEKHEHGVCRRGSLQALISAPDNEHYENKAKIVISISLSVVSWNAETACRLWSGSLQEGKWDKRTSKPKPCPATHPIIFPNFNIITIFLNVMICLK